MKRIIAYTLFWFAMGMLVMLLMGNTVFGIILIAVCILVSYLMFGC